MSATGSQGCETGTQTVVFIGIGTMDVTVKPLWSADTNSAGQAIVFRERTGTSRRPLIGRPFESGGLGRGLVVEKNPQPRLPFPAKLISDGPF